MKDAQLSNWGNRNKVINDKIHPASHVVFNTSGKWRLKAYLVRDRCGSSDWCMNASIPVESLGQMINRR